MGRCYLSNSGFCMVILLLASSCFGVGANQIAAAVLGGYRSLDAIGQALQAGTNCGSCRSGDSKHGRLEHFPG
jgi:BFD-like [2Fe-2S] binding domain